MRNIAFQNSYIPGFNRSSKYYRNKVVLNISQKGILMGFDGITGKYRNIRSTDETLELGDEVGVGTAEGGWFWCRITVQGDPSNIRGRNCQRSD